MLATIISVFVAMLLLEAFYGVLWNNAHPMPDTDTDTIMANAEDPFYEKPE